MKIRALSILALLLTLAISPGCHEDSDDESSGSGTDSYSGRFSDDPVQGIFYEVLLGSNVEVRGQTDALGRFRYPRDRDRPAVAVFFLGADALGSNDRLELGRASITAAETELQGLVLTPADLSRNFQIVWQLSSFLQGVAADGGNMDTLRIENSLHSSIAAHTAVTGITDGPYVAGTRLLRDFADLPGTGNAYPTMPDAIARLQAAQRCHAAGVYRYTDSDSNSGSFALPASTPTNSIYGLSDAGNDLRGALRASVLSNDNDLTFREIESDGMSRSWNGRFARDYRSITRTSGQGPEAVQRLSDSLLTDMEWRMVSTATGSVLLELNFHADDSISGVRIDADSGTPGREITGSYTGDSPSRLALDDVEDSSGTYTLLGISGLETRLRWSPTEGGAAVVFTADLCRP